MISSLFNRLMGSGNRRSALLIAAGAASGQLLTLLLSPLLARLFSPEDFGAFAIYAGVIGFASVLCTMRYEYAIPVVETDREARHIAITLMLLTIVIATIAAFCVYWFGPTLLTRFELKPYQSMFMLIPLGIAAFAVFQLFLYIALRGRNFANVAISRAGQGGAVGVGQTVFGLFGFTTLGLAAGHATSNLVGILLLTRQGLRQLRGGFSISQAWPILVRFRDYFLFSTPAALVNVTAVRLPSVMFTVLAGASVGGSFAFCQSLFSAPVMLFGRSVGQVYFAELASRIRAGNVKLESYFLRVVTIMAAVATIPTLFLVFASPWLFEWLFGPTWELAGKFAQVLALVLFAEFIVIPVTQTLEALQKQRVQFIWDSGRLLGIAVTIWWCLRSGFSILFTIKMYVCVLLLSYLVLLILMYMFLKRRSCHQ